MQNDFISGSLGSEAAEKIVPLVLEKVKSFDGEVVFTRDTHDEKYLKAREGRLLPVPHCVKNTTGWEICDELKPYALSIVDKNTFGSLELEGVIKRARAKVEEIELCGLCTDICVISNAMLLKAAFPEADVTVDSRLCAGVTRESHETALKAMSAVQITIK